MISSIFSFLFKVFTFLAVIAAPFAAQAGDPPLLVDFNNEVFKVSNKAMRRTLDIAGENSAGCDVMMVAVSNAMFRCLRDKAKCVPTTSVNGTPTVTCAGDDSECDQQANTAAEGFLAESGACKEINEDVLKPGCGNKVTEFGEECDLGEANGTPNAACSGICKASAVAAPASAEGSATAPVAAQPQAGNSATGGTCAFHPLGNPSFSFWYLLTLGMGAGLLGVFRRKSAGK